MKKLMIAACAVAFAAAAQAATIDWSFTWTTPATGTANAYGVDTSLVNGNSTFAAGTTGNTDWMKKGTMTAILQILDASGGVIAQSDSFDIGYKSSGSKVSTTGIVINADENAFVKGSKYSFNILVDGKQDSLTALGVKGDWDYTNAKVKTEIGGELTISTMATTEFASNNPSSWTVYDAVAVPEPTSGLLLLLGVAGLALRRRRA